MHITFTSSSNNQLCLELIYPKEFGSSGNLEERNSSVADEWGSIHIKEMWFEGACLLYSDINLTKPCAMKLKCDSFCWLMNFILDGEIDTQHDAVSAHMLLKKGEYHTFYCSSLNMNMAIDRPTKAFTICLTRRFVRKLLGKDILPEYFEGGGEEPFTLVTTDTYGNGRLRGVIEELMEAGQPGYIRRIFLEAKILEALSFQLEKLESNQNAAVVFNKEDITRLHNARTIIEKNLQTPCSLIELARKSGLNDYKLKKGFKSLFGHTVFGYLFEQRMERAYKLLEDGHSVSLASEEVGYKNPHHFTAAFKKKFNLLPSQVGKIISLCISGYLSFIFSGISVALNTCNYIL